jgi:hypothetical protein
MTEELTRLAELIRSIYDIVSELEQLAPGRKLTPDGHMVGSIGEIWAAYQYGLVLLPNSTAVHDAESLDGRKVQVKTTQGSSVATYLEQPEHLLVLKLQRDGTVEECFNGPAALVWPHLGKAGKNGQCRIGLSRLRDLMLTVPPDQRLRKVA